ncbi:VanW family protein [Bacillus salipaludis]|uniref:VanW family protein n=1 Tax=Bacillus salipaludis TaxID=2547811 RepID=UPI003AF31AAD
MMLSWLLGLMVYTGQMLPQDTLSITKDGRTISVVKRAEFSYQYPGLPIIAEQKYNSFLDQLDQQLTVPSKDARLDQNGNIVAEQVGYQVYRKAFTEQFYAFYFGNSSVNLEIPMLPVYPRIDSELLADIKSKRIGRYVTSFNSGNKTRTNNIKLAVKAINNYVIFPGEKFSFNQVVGKRTAEKGYLRAPVIVRGEYSEDIGGGICQVSSTLFNAVDNAGLQIVQRFSHTREVPYIPKGRDATVSWFGPDFEFKNKYNQPVLIRAKTLGNLLVIKLYSSEVINYQPKEVPNPPY